jgi:hypothetical protein
VVVDDLDVEWSGLTVWPFEANPPSIVDANAVLPCSIPSEALTAIARQAHQSRLVWSGLENLQPLVRLALDGLNLADPFSRGKPRGAFVSILSWPKPSDPALASHTTIKAGETLYVKRNKWH